MEAMNVDARAIEWLDYRVYDSCGQLVGVVVGVYDGASDGGSQWLAVGMGTFGLRMAVVPAAGALAWGSDIVVAYDRDTILAAPPGDVHIALEPDDEAALTAHYARRRTLSRPVPLFDRKRTHT